MMRMSQDKTELIISKWDTILRLNLESAEVNFIEHENDRIYLDCGKVYVASVNQ